MKRIFATLLAVLLLTSCSAHTVERSIEEKDVKRIVYQCVDSQRMILLDQEEIQFVLNVAPTEYISAWVWQDQSASTIDEVAVFIADKNSENLLYQKLEQYLLRCKGDKKEWLESYNPAEADKLSQGKLFRYGNCMGYVFLNEDEMGVFLKELNEFYSTQE